VQVFSRRLLAHPRRSLPILVNMARLHTPGTFDQNTDNRVLVSGIVMRVMDWVAIS
jgi:FtsZ-interacting cell division protein ZipA